MTLAALSVRTVQGQRLKGRGSRVLMTARECKAKDAEAIARPVVVDLRAKEPEETEADQPTIGRQAVGPGRNAWKEALVESAVIDGQIVKAVNL